MRKWTKKVIKQTGLKLFRNLSLETNLISRSRRPQSKIGSSKRDQLSDQGTRREE